jgi:hypothetical protein
VGASVRPRSSCGSVLVRETLMVELPEKLILERDGSLSH